MKSKTNNNLVKEQFGREADKYVTSKVHSSESDLQFVKKFIDPKPSWSILDIATGAGHLALTLAPEVKDVIASDITEKMLTKTEHLARSREIANMKTEIIDVHNIPYDDNVFDLTSCRIAPHHFHNIELAISEMVRVTKNGGLIFVEDTISPENSDAAKLFNKIEKLRDKSHVRDLSFKEWSDLFTKLGCKVIKKTKRAKEWDLRWWTERMSTPEENVKTIISLLEDNFNQYKEHLNITQKQPYVPGDVEDVIDQWKMEPYNGYFLVRKKSISN